MSLFLKIVLGKVVSRKAVLDLDLAYKLVDLGTGLPFEVVSGKTVCTNDFYEGTDDIFLGKISFDKI